MGDDKVIPRFCRKCIFLSVTEEEQNDTKPKLPHICNKYNEQVKHYKYHPELPVLDQCNYTDD